MSLWSVPPDPAGVLPARQASPCFLAVTLQHCRPRMEADRSSLSGPTDEGAVRSRLLRATPSLSRAHENLKGNVFKTLGTAHQAQDRNSPGISSSAAY